MPSRRLLRVTQSRAREQADMKYRCTTWGELGTVAWNAVQRRRDRRRRRVRTKTQPILNGSPCAARCRLDTRHRLAARARRFLLSPCLRAAGASVRPRDVCPGDAIGLSHPFDSPRDRIRSRETRYEVSVACARRSMGCRGHRRLGRVRPHRVCGMGVSSGTRAGRGGEPA
jgi:hypothetical protein